MSMSNGLPVEVKTAIENVAKTFAMFDRKQRALKHSELEIKEGLALHTTKIDEQIQALEELEDRVSSLDDEVDGRIASRLEDLVPLRAFGELLDEENIVRQEDFSDLAEEEMREHLSDWMVNALEEAPAKGAVAAIARDVITRSAANGVATSALLEALQQNAAELHGITDALHSLNSTLGSILNREAAQRSEQSAPRDLPAPMNDVVSSIIARGE